VADRNQIERCELGILLAELGNAEAVDILDMHTGGNGQRLMERTQLDALSAEPAGQVGALRR
jgi:hypothetical protein